MAETLGSLIDKLSIKCIREYYLMKMKKKGSGRFSRKEIESRLALLKCQKKQIYNEIEAFLAAARKGLVSLKDEKIKLYNPKAQMNRVKDATSIARAVDGLIRKNLELWRLEDEARRDDVSLSCIGKIKRAIDPTNQQRNDYLDRIDELLEKALAQ